MKTVRKKLEPEEKPVCNVVTVYRERGNYLQRLEQFEKAIQAYSEALRWNNSDVRSLLGRSLARVKATYYIGALEDAAKAAALEPDNIRTLEIRSQTEYAKCAFEHSLMLAHRGVRQRRCPTNLAECVRHAEETIRDCTGKGALKVLSRSTEVELKNATLEGDCLQKRETRRRRILPQSTHQVEEMSRIENQRAKQISRLMASKYLERMAHDKYFLIGLCKDERLASANVQGSKALQEMADKAFADLEKRQAVLRERRPFYAARASEKEAVARLSRARKERLTHSQKQHEINARRLVQAAADMYEKHDTIKCLEHAEFAMEQIVKISTKLLPKKEKFFQELYDIVANAFLDQKRVTEEMSESDRELRALVLLGMSISREPSRDSILRARPMPPLDCRRRIRTLERALLLSARIAERCYILHELSRLHAETKHAHRARFYAFKCQSEARAANHRVWLLNATFLLARCYILQNNRAEGRAMLIEGRALARNFGYGDIAAFFDTCANVSMDVELSIEMETLEKREQAMVSLMQDDDMKSAAKHLFRRMSAVPASRRFSVMPGVRAESTPSSATGRRMSIMPRNEQPTRISQKSRHPLGLQDFDNI